MNENGLFLQPTRFMPLSNLTRLCRLAKTDWKQGEDEESWATKAIESLVKKLKKEENAGKLETLERALTYPDQPSECVTIQRSLDGRLQVNHKKGLPHVMYCRVWRWPDLQAHQELTSLAFCQNPYSSKQTTICVNPYHYARVEAQQILPAVLVPRKGDSMPSEKSTFFRTMATQMNKLVGRLSHVVDSPSPGYSPSLVSSHSHPVSPYSCMSDEDQMQIDDCCQNQARMISPCSDHMDVDMMSMAPGNMLFGNENFNQFPSIWCAISYYELNSRVGETYEVDKRRLSVTVDGFTDPTSRTNRFCLGILSNINRSTVVQQTRDSIGKGIRITYDYREEYQNKIGDVYIQCLSDYAVFVHSLNSSYFRGFHKNTICKIPPGKALKIFDAKSFIQLLEETSQKLAEWGERCPELHEKLQKTCSELHKMALVYLSFARGWGAEYKHQFITSTPCWIEIRLNQPLKLYDLLVGSKIHGPDKMSSVT